MRGDSRYEPVELASDTRRVWKGWSGIFRGESSGLEEPSSMSTSMSDESELGKASTE